MDDIPIELSAISCYFCRHYFLTVDDQETQKGICSKFDFELNVYVNRFSAIFSRCEHFEDSGRKI